MALPYRNPTISRKESTEKRSLISAMATLNHNDPNGLNAGCGLLVKLSILLCLKLCVCLSIS